MCQKYKFLYTCVGFIVFSGIVFSAPESISFQNNQQSISEKESLRIQIQNLAQESGRSSTKLQKAIDSVDEIIKPDTIPLMNTAINTIEHAEKLYFKANQDSDRLSEFIIKNKTRLKKSNLGVFVDLEGLTNEKYYTHRRALGNFLNTYKTMLEYLRDNLNAIVQGQKQQRDIYNQLFYKYKIALDANNEAYLLYRKFVDQYTSKRPALAEIMSNARHDLGE